MITKEQILKDNTYKMTLMGWLKYVIIIGLAVIIGFINLINLNSPSEMLDIWTVLDTLYTIVELHTLKENGLLSIILIAMFICTVCYIIADNMDNFKLRYYVKSGKYTINNYKIIDIKTENYYGTAGISEAVLDNTNLTIFVNENIKVGDTVCIITLNNGRMLKPYFNIEYKDEVK